MATAFLPTDGGQRKRKDDGEQEWKPAKRKSVGNEDDSVPDRVDDMTATALQNLQLAKDQPELQQGTDPATTSGLQPTIEHPLSDSSISEPTAIKQASSTGYQPTGTEPIILYVRDRIVLWWLSYVFCILFFNRLNVVILVYQLIFRMPKVVFNNMQCYERSCSLFTRFKRSIAKLLM